MNGPILVFGARGQAGREIVSLAAARGLPVVGLSRSEADITNETTVRAAVDVHRPSVVVNSAAYTAVERAEREPEIAVANVTGPTVLATVCASTGVPLIYLSCDYVFNGAKKSAYVEGDRVAPISVYGRTKAEGEAKIRELLPRQVILRTSWIYGPHGQNFLRNILKLASEREELRIVSDQFGCPTATIDIAEAVLAVARKLATEAKVSGIFHFAGTGAISRYGFASEIVQRQAIFTGRTPKVTEIKMAEYPLPPSGRSIAISTPRAFARRSAIARHPGSTGSRRVVAALLPPAWQEGEAAAMPQQIASDRPLARGPADARIVEALRHHFFRL